MKQLMKHWPHTADGMIFHKNYQLTDSIILYFKNKLVEAEVGFLLCY